MGTKGVWQRPKDDATWDAEYERIFSSTRSSTTGAQPCAAKRKRVQRRKDLAKSRSRATDLKPLGE